MSFIKEFKEFAMRGNVIDLAVAVVVGGAFGKIVDSLVSDIIMPMVGRLIGGIDFSHFYLDLRGRKPQVCRDVFHHRGNVRRDFRRLTNHRRIHIHRFPTRRAHARIRFAQQHAAVRTGVRRVGVGKQTANVAQGSSAQQRIGERVQQHVGIRMPKQAAFKRNAHAADDARSPRHQRVHVKPLTNPERTLAHGINPRQCGFAAPARPDTNLAAR